MAIARLGGIVTPGTSTYPSQDGTFALVRGTGAHYGNALIGGKYIVAGGQVGSNYDLDDNNTGSLLAPNQAPAYKVGSEMQAFIDATPTSPEYLQYEKDERAAEEVANPKLKAYDDALRAWAMSQQPPVHVDPVFGFATNFSWSEAPAAVVAAYADFTGHPIPPPPVAPSGPAMYLVAGYLFDANGVVYDQSTHQPNGQTLTAEQVHSLLTTGQLTTGSTPPGTAPASPPPTRQAPSSGPTSSTGTTSTTGGGASVPTPSANASDVGTNVSAANPGMSIAPVSSPGGDPGSSPTAPQAATTDVATPWMLYAALGVIALVAVRSSKR